MSDAKTGKDGECVHETRQAFYKTKVGEDDFRTYSTVHYAITCVICSMVTRCSEDMTLYRPIVVVENKLTMDEYMLNYYV